MSHTKKSKQETKKKNPIVLFMQLFLISRYFF